MVPWWLVIKTVSGPWMLQTVVWVHEAGLMKWWNEMALYATFNMNRATYYPDEIREPDLIDIKRIAAIILGIVFLQLLCVIIFVKECMLNHNLDIMVLSKFLLKMYSIWRQFYSFSLLRILQIILDLKTVDEKSDTITIQVVSHDV